MNLINMDYKKEDYIKFMQLYSHQSWLCKKEPNLEALIEICDTREQKNLVFSLLDRFHYLKEDMVHLLLEQMADYIVNCEFEKSRTLLVASTYDEEADSGQKILDMLKVPLYERRWRDVKTVNIIGKAIRPISQGKDQIIIIDEFLGTGRTLRTRVEWLKKNANQNIDIKCCFMAGMRNAVEALNADSIKIFCPLQLEKGISEYFEGDRLAHAEHDMLCLESKLAQRIQEKYLADYSFGFGKAEALYSLENGNTPNSVFPIFWWIKDQNGNERKTILTRYEKGFE